MVWLVVYVLGFCATLVIAYSTLDPYGHLGYTIWGKLWRAVIYALAWPLLVVFVICVFVIEMAADWWWQNK